MVEIVDKELKSCISMTENELDEILQEESSG
jgi:hypothetical protein